MGSDRYLDRDYDHYEEIRKLRRELKRREEQLKIAKGLIRFLVDASKCGDMPEVKEALAKLEERISDVKKS